MKTIFFDRDGTLINEPASKAIASWEDFKMRDDIGSLKKLNDAGYTLFIISNQTPISTGALSMEFYEETNKKLVEELEKLSIKIEHIYTCPHGPDDNCSCRKPKRGLIDQAL